MGHIVRPRYTRPLAWAVLFAAFACGDATGVAPEDLAGTWEATAAVATNAADAAETEDLIALGVALTFVIGTDGTLESIFEYREIVDRDVGTYSIADGVFSVNFPGQVATGTISRRNETMTIDITTGMEWDFRTDGLDEPAMFALTMQRTAR